MKNIKFGKSIIYFILPLYSLLVHLIMTYKLIRKQEFKKSLKMLSYSFTKYNIFLNIITGVVLEEVVVYETYGKSDSIKSGNSIPQKNKKTKEKSILDKLLKKPDVTANQVAPIYN
ncbi:MULTISPECIES: hypothetical protein [Staphylococcus]|uniref:hypothetical protein n=1 Tax=Staphylococcus TaxID=1279 RepID=UPI001304FF19|nr:MULTISPECIES: hypothetical protein [Staphylococcus]MEB5784477.1 hypothetical protein [Staphylococcus pseudoxylosus]